MDQTKYKIAYFTMEIGIRNSIPTYSGGLGVLAGDTIKSCADLEIPLIAITMLNEHGYFFQQITRDGSQTAQPTNWAINDYLELTPAQATISIQDRQIHIQVWQYIVKGETGFEIPVYFLDTNIASNNEFDRHLTSHLYKGGDLEYRLSQEMVLGIGGYEIIKKLGFANINKYHMNEGHSALLTLKLNQDLSHSSTMNCANTKPYCIFTTHTPVAAGHDQFPIDMANRFLSHYTDHIPEEVIQNNMFQMTQLALHSSGYTNAVSKKHSQVANNMFPGFNIHSITNGIHPKSWVSAPFAKLFDKYAPEWRVKPATLTNISQATDSEISDAHYISKKKLIDFTNQLSNVGMDNDFFTICFGRRITAYKRPDLILQNPERIAQINNIRPIQIIYAGKAHPSDMEGQAIIKRINQIKNDFKNDIKIAYLENYNIKVAKLMTQGGDIWLNNPIPGQEASGTSGMKAAINGVPSLSTLDGWWEEGWQEEITGWAINNPEEKIDQYTQDELRQRHADTIYEKLEKHIVPNFYNNQALWLSVMRNAIVKNGTYFNSHRMVQEYWEQAWSK
ncbi:MAG: alpha-glucan family phosphorylase [Patescibacteria group bacterium]